VVLDAANKAVRNHGAYTMTMHRFESQGMLYLRFENWLRDLLLAAKPALVGFEEVPRHRGVHAAHRYGGVVALIMKVCDQLEVPYTGVPIATWKRLATGKGNASKDAVMDAFIVAHAIHDARDPATEWTQDEIDAYYIACHTAHQLGEV
jgi:Holliday junction resolvasome RuvABC endonuclease subunit